MTSLRCSALLTLVLLMLSSGSCKERTDSSTSLGDKSLFNFIMKMIRDLKKQNAEEENGVQHTSQQEDYSSEAKEDLDYGLYHEQRVEIVPRDLRMKEKFLKHLTGRLSFPSPNCNKIFRRLYNTTRDCTIPTRVKEVFAPEQIIRDVQDSSVGWQLIPRAWMDNTPRSEQK